MAMTLLEKIITSHSGRGSIAPGEITDVEIDVRAARDFGGANVISHIRQSGLSISDPLKTFFTFDCNPTGSDQKYAVNQHICRLFAREHAIKVFDIDAGIGTHIMIDKGLALPGSTAVSTDSHANVLGAVGAFGQGMGDMDIAAAWHSGKIWFKMPRQVKLNLEGRIPESVTPKDIVLNLLGKFGADGFLGESVEIAGDVVEQLDLDDRITISSMATEMGAIIILFPPSGEIIKWFRNRSEKPFEPVFADPDAIYDRVIDVDISDFRPVVSLPGAPHNIADLDMIRGIKIDSAFIGSCTNGRLSDMRKAARILEGKKTAPGVVLKIVPATTEIWDQCLDEGLITIFRKAGALVSNPGCAGCAAGQVGQNGPGEITVSTGNRNFAGKQGKGSVYLASPDIAAASAVAGYITAPGDTPVLPTDPQTHRPADSQTLRPADSQTHRPTDPKTILEGRVWLIQRDNIDTDMIFHNRYLSITDIGEMGRYTFDNLEGFKSFASEAQPGDIVVAGNNFGCGSSRQQAVDCFRSLGINAIIARSFGSIYERNAINAAFPIISVKSAYDGILNNGDMIKINLETGHIENMTLEIAFNAEPMSDAQLDIYRRGGLLKT
jgi:3-isopropylmalate/(R)-2-methylmalate dehydratase large subunit